MKKKIAILKNGFVENYVKAFTDLCNKNNTQCDVLDEINEFADYEFVLTERWRTHKALCFITHVHSPLYKAKTSNIFYRTIFLLGHLSKILKMRKNFLSAVKVFVVSSTVKQDLIENYGLVPEKVFVAYPGFSYQQNNDLKKIPKICKDGVFNIAMCAPGFVTKGGYVMLDALRIFRKLYPDIKIHLSIIYPKHKTNLGVNLYIKLFGLSDCVTFLGRQEDMAAYYEKADCFVCPSVYEAFGRVVVEAMYAKRPVILGSNVGASEIVKDGVNAFVYNADKKRAYNLAQKIKEVYDRYNDLDELIENAYELSKTFTWENFAKQIFEGLYGKISG